MSGLQIRKAIRDDCKAVRALIQELADFEKMSDGPKISYETLERDGFDTDHPLFHCFVATFDQKVIGYAISYYTYSTWCGKAMYLEDLYVTHKFRQQHVGSQLLKAVAKVARDNNCCRLDFVVLNWNSAQEFYKQKGAVDLTVKEDFHCYRLSDKSLSILADSQ